LEKLNFTPEALAIHNSINRTAAPFPDCSVKRLFERCADRRSTATALVGRDETLSYRELNGLANSLAARLRLLNVSPGQTVGVCANRSVELIIALLAVIKCGAAYLPFNPEWPDEVLHSIFDDARCRFLIKQGSDGKAGDGGFSGRFPRYKIVDLFRHELDPADDNPAIDVPGDAIAYINFTSGTTGRSKGVQIQHHSIARLVTSPSYAALDEHTVLLHTSPSTFDAATFEIWGALLNGGICALYPPETLRFSGLRHAVQRWGVNCVFITTALFNALIDEDADTLNGVETVLFGGEAYSDRHVRQAFESYGGGRLVHVYGPTECTTFATYYPIDRMPPPSAELPIGRPIQNTTLYVVSDGWLCRPGEVGEILLGGPGLSPGYLEAGFVSQAGFAEFDIDGTPQRLYRTGDYGYLLDSGDLIFQGRTDDQIKFNGFRVELSLVSRELGKHPDVSQSYITLTDGAAGEKMLLAFVIPQHGKFDPGRIRKDLKASLPSYMVPGAIHACDALPLLATGKVDRRALLSLHEESLRALRAQELG
jgi:D-alanine--poly(phosphoribitol) ligase subunit 1